MIAFTLLIWNDFFKLNVRIIPRATITITDVDLSDDDDQFNIIIKFCFGICYLVGFFLTFDSSYETNEKMGYNKLIMTCIS